MCKYRNVESKLNNNTDQYSLRSHRIIIIYYDLCNLIKTYNIPQIMIKMFGKTYKINVNISDFCLLTKK